MRFTTILLSGAMLAAATPAFAQEETAPAPAISVSGSVTGVTDYRFRGLTQTDEGLAVQGGITVAHESGFYASVWASTIDDTTSLPGYGDAEVDLSAGYTKTLSNGIGVDVGLLYYYYPDGAKGAKTDFFEPYASISYTAGPVTAKVGANYAWSGQAGLANNDSLYLRGDVTVAVPGTPLSFLGHVGHTDGQLGILSPSSKYIDYSFGVEAAQDAVKLGIQYVDTDIKPNAYANTIGADGTVLAYLTVSF